MIELETPIAEQELEDCTQKLLGLPLRPWNNKELSKFINDFFSGRPETWTRKPKKKDVPPDWNHLYDTWHEQDGSNLIEAIRLSMFNWLFDEKHTYESYSPNYRGGNRRQIFPQELLTFLEWVRHDRNPELYPKPSKPRPIKEIQSEPVRQSNARPAVNKPVVGKKIRPASKRVR